VSALAFSGLPPSRLELEITESVLLEKTERNIVILNQLRQMGVRISMDDFGTGYSSIGYLRSFPFDKIKIDQSFVRDLMVDKGSLAIVRAIAGLGVSFGMTTTAEGVETEEQMRCLDLEGCIEVQGYLYSKPVPADEVAELLTKLREKHFRP
jgi:EAL domain-containing protein (putative c-di-GMP-specific phosphodiesterase class I)